MCPGSCAELLCADCRKAAQEDKRGRFDAETKLAEVITSRDEWERLANFARINYVRRNAEAQNAETKLAKIKEILGDGYVWEDDIATHIDDHRKILEIIG